MTLGDPIDGRAISLGARLAHRLAMHVRTRPAMLVPAGPMMSITFDDVPDSACAAGAALLDAYGAKGTFYVSGALVGTRTRHWHVAGAETLAAIHANGHEIGCHTHSHALVVDLDARSVAEEVRRNQACLADLVPGSAVKNFAFPYGYASLSAKRALSATYTSSRSIVPGLNAGRIDRHFLRANPLVDGRMDARRIGRLMDEAVARNAWLIFYGHDVAQAPSPYGCSPALLEAALDAAARRGVPAVSVAEGLARGT